MGIKYRWAKLAPSRDLCGATPEEFAALVERLAPMWEARRRESEARPGRLRAPGAGRKPAAFWVQLLATMTMWRQGSTTRATGQMFGVDARSIRRWRDGVEDLLLAHGFQPPGVARPIRTVEDLVEYVEANEVERVMVDGTEVPAELPGSLRRPEGRVLGQDQGPRRQGERGRGPGTAAPVVHSEPDRGGPHP